MYDVLIIGAGCVGSAIARELSRYKLKIAVLDKENDVACGTSKANSGIVHGGYDATYGTLKAALSKVGNESFTKLSEELGFELNRCGSFVLAFNEEQNKKIEALYENGKKNGIEGLSIVDSQFVQKKERNVADNVLSALYCSTAGIISPYQYTWALIENAVTNGVDLFLNNKVESISRDDDSFFTVKTNSNVYRTKKIVNASGVYADDVAKLLYSPEFKITPIRGEYMLFDKNEGKKLNTVVFQTPSGVSKGILVSPTVHGNIFVGPSYDVTDDKDDVTTHSEILDSVFKTAKLSVPSIDRGKVITQFAGIRAVSDNADFIIEESEIKGFINAAGICSPGLSTSYAIALKVRDILADSMLLDYNVNFNPYREKPIVINDLNPAGIDDIIKSDKTYGRIVCRCEKITEGEIRGSLTSPVPAKDLDGVKRRVRAGMGRCQGGFCMQRVMELICEVNGERMSDVTKNGDGSFITTGKIFE